MKRLSCAARFLLLGAFAVLPCATRASSSTAAEPTHRPKPKLVLLIAEGEYDTARTLPLFAAQSLEPCFHVMVVHGAPAPAAPSFAAIYEVTDADVLLVSVRRYTPPPAQLEIIRRYVQSGRPIVGIRTASHAFVLRDAEPPAGQSAWPEWGEEVIGCHYDHRHTSGKTVTITAVPPLHPLLTGVSLPFTNQDSLYRVTPLRPGATPLLLGTAPGEPPQPVAWTFTHVGGGKTFYTALGSPTDFANPAFRRLLRNGVRWAAGLPMEETSASSVLSERQP